VTGYTGDTYCNDCNQTVETGTVIPLKDHDWGTGSVTTPASCTATGVRTYTCSVCKDTKTETIDKTAHDTELEGYVAPTCTAKGFSGNKVCKNCKQTIENGKETEMAAHTLDEGTVDKEATCTEKGVKTYTCTVCGVYTETEPIDMIAHSVPAATDAKEATCTEDGATGTGVCELCGQTISTSEVIPALGHSWDDGVETTPATTTSTGVKTYTCTVCKETKEEVIPMLDETEEEPTEPEEPSDEEPGTTEETPEFTDIETDTWYSEAVEWAVKMGITKGTSDSTFSPGDECTRAQIVTFLWRAAGCPEPTITENPFTDVDEDNDYYKAILWAAENGITTGTGDGTFDPYGSCSREQVVTFIWRANGEPEPEGTGETFSDVASDSYYSKAVAWAAEQSITNGMGGGKFGTNVTCNRAQVVTFLYRNAQD
jgi:hypothetical protein